MSRRRQVGAAGRRRAALAVAALAAAMASWAVPASAQVALPLVPPAAAHPLVADFVAVCSRGVVDPAAAASEARARGYVPQGAEGSLDNAVADVLRASSGFAALKKDDVSITLVRSAFPHMIVLSCNMMKPGGVADVDTAVLAAIPGVDGTVATEGAGRIGRWSLLDRQGEVSLITETAQSERFWQLSMTRAVRTARGTPAPN